LPEENKIDFGSIQIHKKVLVDIAVTATESIEGVSLMTPNLKSRFMEFLGRTNNPGVAVSIDKENQVTITVFVLVHYGKHIPDIARLVQDAIRTNIEQTTDINLSDVHVNIQGIERGEQ